MSESFGAVKQREWSPATQHVPSARRFFSRATPLSLRARRSRYVCAGLAQRSARKPTAVP